MIKREFTKKPFFIFLDFFSLFGWRPFASASGTAKERDNEEEQVFLYDQDYGYLLWTRLVEN